MGNFPHSHASEMKKLKHELISSCVATTSDGEQQQLEFGVCDGFSLRHAKSPENTEKSDVSHANFGVLGSRVSQAHRTFNEINELEKNHEKYGKVGVMIQSLSKAEAKGAVYVKLQLIRW